MAGNVVEVASDGPVETLRINRPDRENRLNLAVLEALTSALEGAAADPDLGALVLTGTGETFCCGGDVAEFAVGDAPAYRRFGELFAGVHLAIARFPRPVLAAVNGDVRAGGMSLLSICDVAIAREGVRFAMPEISAGLWPIMAMVALNRVLPRKAAFELYYGGEPLDAGRARELGLINWIVPAEDLDASVRRRARQLAALPRSAVAMGKRTFEGIAERSLEEGYRFSAGRLVELLTDPEVVRALAREREGS